MLTGAGSMEDGRYKNRRAKLMFLWVEGVERAQCVTSCGTFTAPNKRGDRIWLCSLLPTKNKYVAQISSA